METSPADHEVEVKLLADSAAALRAVARRETLGSFHLHRRGVATLETTYLDTPQLTLLANGIALRLRRQGRRWEATVKWAGKVTGSVHSRREINVPLPHKPALPFALPDGELHDELFAYVLDRPLQPVLMTRIRRQLFDLVGSGDAVAAELALDTVRHGRDPKGLGAAYYEVEVERRAVRTEELCALADILAGEHALVPTDETKFQRAQRDVLGLTARSATTIDPNDDWSAAARKIASGQLARLRAQDARLRGSDEPEAEAIHQMRVATRRLRTMCQIFAAAIPARTLRRLATELEWLGTTLGTARDLDVQLAQLSSTLPESAARHPALVEMFATLAAARGPARQQLRATLSSSRYVRLLGSLETFSTTTRRQRGALVPEAGALAIERAHRAVRKRAKRALGAVGARPFHELRIRCRRLRYLLEFLAPILDKDADWTIARLTLFQDLLGEANDRIILAGRLRHYASTGLPLDQEQRAAILAIADDLLLTAGTLHERFRARWLDDAAPVRKRVRRLAEKLRTGRQTS